MKKNNISFVKIFGFIALFLFCYFFFLPFYPLLIAGVILSGILGKVSGKVGPVVGGDWKGINYLRSYVIPANPQTPGQVTQRTRFTTIQDYARQVLSTLIQPYWDQYQTGQSGYNAIMSDWLLNADANDLLVSDCSVSKGTLSQQLLDGVEYDTATGITIFDWTQSLVGNQLATDIAIAVIFDKSSGLLYFWEDGDLRSGNSLSMTITIGLTATNLECYLFFSQGTGSTMIVSDSDHVTATAA